MTALSRQAAHAGSTTPEWLRPVPSPGLPADRESFEQAVRAAIEQDRILPFYQPILALGTGDIAGFEALARWHHPELGLLESTAFAAAFDVPATARAIGQHLLAHICRDVLAFERAGARIPLIGLNVSCCELAEGGYAETLGRQLAEIGLPPERLTIELGHGATFAMADAVVVDELHRLAALGVNLALDGFGAGFAALTQLRRVPVDRIKIDRSFIAGIEEEPNDAALVAGLIGLARRLGLKTVALGVETPGQLAFLREERCDFAQGYLLGRPMPAVAVPHFATGVLAA